MAETKIFGLRTTANREDQVMDFVSSNAAKKKLKVYSLIRPHGMRGYIFVEAETMQDAELAALNIPYAKGILPKEIDYKEIEHMLEMVKVEMNIRKNDIVEIIAGPFKREQAKVTRIDKVKEEVVVELLEAAVPIPITVKMDAVKVIRREDGAEEEGEKEFVMPSAKQKGPFEISEEELEELPMPKEDRGESKREKKERKKEEKAKERAKEKAKEEAKKAEAAPEETKKDESEKEPEKKQEEKTEAPEDLEDDDTLDLEFEEDAAEKEEPKESE